MTSAAGHGSDSLAEVGATEDSAEETAMMSSR